MTSSIIPQYYLCIITKSFYIPGYYVVVTSAGIFSLQHLELDGPVFVDKVKSNNVRTGLCCEGMERGEREQTWKSVNVRCRQGALCSLNFTAKSSASDSPEPRQCLSQSRRNEVRTKTSRTDLS